MVNEFVYCPRLFALEHLDGQWADNADTARGQRVHRRVDRPDDRGLPEDPAPTVRRSLELGSERLGVLAKIDLVELEGSRAVPVDYKKGKVPPGGPWDPERVQVALQALLLREHGYDVPHAVLYFAGSKRRVEVELDDALLDLAARAIQGARALRDAPVLPPPLTDSPKCPRCSLVGICLPDEHHRLADPAAAVRPIAPARDDGVPLYVEERGAKLALRGGEIVIKVQGETVSRVRLLDTTAVVVRGAASITTPLLHALADRSIPLSLLKWGGQHVSQVVPVSGHHALGRVAQHRVAADPVERLAIARAIVVGKIKNQRVLIRRNHRGARDDALRQLEGLAKQAKAAPDTSVLLGLEGNAARTYFGALPGMLKAETLAAQFDANGRNRRPPRDPINALLSFAYGALARECLGALYRVGLDPQVGIYHTIRPGRPALALDLMEEFRPVIADSVVLRAVNTGMLGPPDFIQRTTGVSMNNSGRRKFIRAIEERFSEECTHPVFGTRLSYRRIVEVQARMLSKTFLGEVPVYPVFRIR